MKTCQVILSSRANRSFQRILRYITQHDSEEKALHVEAGLLEAIEKLTTFPHSHPVLQVSKKNTPIATCCNGRIKLFSPSAKKKMMWW